MRYPKGEHGTRSFVFPWRFPYTVVYKVGDDLVIIVAIAHHSKEPGYWHNRT
jgi:ParE-like toxin of type II ParDE toxin-antitoxin system